MLKHRGTMLFGVIILIVFVAVVLSVIGNIATSTQQTTIAQIRATQALMLASSAREASTRLLRNGTSCTGLSAAMGTVNFGPGQFTASGAGTVTGSTIGEIVTDTTSSVIPLATNPGLSVAGSVVVDRELITYTGIGTDLLECAPYNTPTCLRGATRGVNGVTAPTLNAGDSISQYQCTITNTGAVPTIAAPQSSRQIITNIPSGMAWLITANQIYRWDGQWTLFTNNANWNLTQLEVLSYNDAWAVGATTGGNSLILHWDGTSWTTPAGAPNLTGITLNGISCVDSSNCWMAGTNSNFIRFQNGTFTSYNPTTAASYYDAATNPTGKLSGALTPSSSNFPTATITSIYCQAQNACSAVGDTISGSTTPVIFFYNGTSWSRNTSFASGVSSDIQLFGLTCTPNGTCWAVGVATKDGVILKYTPATGLWTQDLLDPKAPASGKLGYKSVACTGDDYCWAVGNAVGSDVITALYNPSNGHHWALDQAPNLPNKTLFGISCAASNDCWTAGAGGLLSHWTGSAWVNDNSFGGNALDLQMLPLASTSSFSPIEVR